jgi:starch synthase
MGGLADVAAALPAELRAIGHDVRVFLPFYSRIRESDRRYEPVDDVGRVPVEIGAKRYSFTLTTTELVSNALPIHLVDCPPLYQRPGIYTSDADEAQRWLLFSRAVLESCQRLDWAPDVFHCNDWHTALIPFLLRGAYHWDALFEKTRTLLTIHNIGYQGIFGGSAVGRLGLERWADLLDQIDLRDDRVNFLRTGLNHTDFISTVSPTYAKEIQTDEYGMGLAPLLRARRDRLVGILNGVDYSQWSPECDPFIPHHFSADDLTGKRENKRGLLEQLGLDPDPEAPLIGMVTRFAQQKGLELCAEVLPRLLRSEDLRLIVLGSGEAVYEKFFDGLQRSSPGRVCYHRGYHDELAHAIEAASDLFLMPSRYEPCGLNQLFGMRYGTLPLVRRTGGLADTVVPYDSADGRGTGFVFEHFSAEGLTWALERALETWQDQERWLHLMDNAMRRDFSWKVQVRPYEALYRKILES